MSKKIPEEVLANLIVNRRHLHQNPELSNFEFETAKFVYEKLKSFGFQPKYLVNKRAVVCDIEGSKPGGITGFRADMDALPIVENSGVPFKSKVEGVMHACGHDMHTSILLGLAEYFCLTKTKPKRDIRLVFQPAEETLDGSRDLIAEGGIDGLSRIFGLHVYPDFPLGSMVCESGTVMASSDRLHISVFGESTHAARPQNGVDGILVASHIVNALQSIVSRELAPATPAVISICQIEGGIAHNVIAPRVDMVGTTRAHSVETRAFLKKRVEEVATKVASSANARVEISWPKGCPPVINDQELSQEAGELLSQIEGLDLRDKGYLNLGAEDFSRYSEKLPAVFFRLGAEESDYPAYSLHSDKLRLNEKSMAVGLSAWVKLATELS